MPAGDTRIRVMAVDDHPLLREGIAAVIREQKDMVLVAEAADGREAIECFRTHHPDITLMDLQMPEVSGIEAIVAIRSEFPQARIIVLTTYSGDAQALRAIRAGAFGITKQRGRERGVKRLRRRDTVRGMREPGGGDHE